MSFATLGRSGRGRDAADVRQCGIALIAAGLVLLFVAEPSAATVFNAPPDSIGDRRVELSWEPDPDDPVFNGNTILRFERRIETIHGPDHAVRALVFNAQGSRLYSFAEGETSIRRYDLNSQTPLEDLPTGGANVTDLSLHSSGRWLLGPVGAQGVAVWDLNRTAEPALYPAGGAEVLEAAYIPNIPDPLNPRFVTVSADDSVRVWAAPGRILGPGYTLSIPGGSLGGLAISQDRAFVAVGTNTGEVRIWDIRTPPLSPRIRLTGGHEAPVRRVIFTNDQQRVASIDTRGHVAIWRFSDGLKLAEFDTAEPGPGQDVPWIFFSPPAGRLLFVVMPDGLLDLREGSTGLSFRAENLVNETISAVGLAPDGIRMFMGDADGVVTVVRAGLCRPSQLEPECFGGYMVWRSPTDDPEDKVLLRVFTYGDSTWTFQGERRAFSDPDSIIDRTRPPLRVGEIPGEVVPIYGPHNGVPYYYSITRFNLVYLGGAVFPEYQNSVEEGFYRDNPNGPPKAIRAQAVAFDQRKDFSEAIPRLRDVIVVPNPFEFGKRSSTPLGDPRVQFRHLPDRATIRIYSLAGDLVRVIQHGRGEYGQSQDSADWDLRNDRGEMVTSGIYIYQVQTQGRAGMPDEVIEGHLAIIL